MTRLTHWLHRHPFTVSYLCVGLFTLICVLLILAGD